MLSEAALAQPQSLEQHKEQLLRAEPVRATLARQRRVFWPSPLASQFDLPADFFNLTAEELKREQRLRSEAVERLSVLRTKAMREREEQREMRKYTYTLLRVRFPDGCLLQGACCVLRAGDAASGPPCAGRSSLLCSELVPGVEAEGSGGWVGSGGLPRAPAPLLSHRQGPSTPGSGWQHCTRLSGRPCRSTGCLLSCWPWEGRSCRRTRTWPSMSAGW